MGSVKRAGSMVVCVVMMLAVAACNGMPIETIEPTIVMASPVITATPTMVTLSPTLSPSSTVEEETATPEPEMTEELEPETTEEPEPTPEYDIPDIKKTGLTNEQFQKIQLMLVGISGSMLYKKPIQSMSDEDYLVFGFFVLNDFYGSDLLPIDSGEDQGESISREDMKKLIESAFGGIFRENCTATTDFEVQLIDNRYVYYLMEGDPRNRPFVYKIKKVGQDTWRLSFDVVGVHFQYSVYQDKVEATIKKNENSIYGFTLVGWKTLKDTTRLFRAVEASSYHVPDSGLTFSPKNVLDGNKDTFWLSKQETESWLKLSFAKSTVMTGFTIDMDFINERFSEELCDVPSNIIVELSNGMKFEYNDYSGAPGFRSFGREIKVKWMKLTLLGESSVEEESQPQPVYRYVIDVYAH